MKPLTLSILFFPHPFQCRIMSPGRQFRVHCYSCTLVQVHKSFKSICCFHHQSSELITWH